MSTVPTKDTPPPPDNAKIHLLGGTAGMYGRPTNGGSPVVGQPEGIPSSQPAPASVPENSPTPLATNGGTVGS